MVALLRNNPVEVRERTRRRKRLVITWPFVGCLVRAVVRRGEEQSGAGNTERLRILLSGDLDLLDFDDEDARTARTAGQVCATLEKAGTPIGAYDLLIAGQALRRGLTVVTASTSGFSRVASLSWQDWTT